MMRYFLLLALSGAALLAPGWALAQEKPSLNTAPGVPTPQPVQPVQPATPTIPAPAATPAEPAAAPAPAAQPLPPPSDNSPSGFELPEREQKRKALQQHAEMYSKYFLYTGAGLSYASNYYSDGGAFNVSISPAIGYRLNDRFSIGPGFTYAYTHQTFGAGYPALNLRNLGGKVFAQAMVYKQFLVHAEYEVTNAQLPLVDANGYYLTRGNEVLTGSRTIYSPLAGVGYRSQFSTRVAADILLLYNFNDSYNNSIYSNPVIRFNFLFNLGH